MSALSDDILTANVVCQILEIPDLEFVNLVQLVIARISIVVLCDFGVCTWIM